MAGRLQTCPGRGALDTVSFVGRVGRELPPISVEPISDALERQPLQVVAEEIVLSTMGVLEQSARP